MTRALDDQKIAWIIDYMHGCRPCMYEGYEHDHEPDECPRDTPCCGARRDDDIAGRCPACGEPC